jgi:hypothetical protein
MKNPEFDLSTPWGETLNYRFVTDLECEIRNSRDEAGNYLLLNVEEYTRVLVRVTMKQDPIEGIWKVERSGIYNRSGTYVEQSVRTPLARTMIDRIVTDFTRLLSLTDGTLLSAKYCRYEQEIARQKKRIAEQREQIAKDEKILAELHEGWEETQRDILEGKKYHV